MTLSSTEKMDGCNAVFANTISYIGCLVVFVVIFIVKLPAEGLFPLVGNMLEGNGKKISPNAIRYILLTAWCFHFLRRGIEVFFVHIYKRKMSWIETLGGVIYYWCLALFNSWAIELYAYNPTYLPLIVIGITLYIIGEIGNCFHHYKLRCFRTKNYEDSRMISIKTGRVVPHGGLFEYILCPHYFCEILTWLGFFMVAWTLWSLLFLLCTIVTLVVYSNRKHEAYLNDFQNESYPKRKRLIPFVF
ncbi:very-long-chain enoyl-CoA reductase-like isoform X1 [Hydractinia symbiolongicarpus]|uniref:very-long-chain enoyl-CoA reductase-like isoform X1 n=2 Tax=Hydractinia symbiolongicarpus TaxID=13093 RepID=UPI0025504D9E|nr:very-long-chain enoyl-CoA reductase-like isoform X1 [Hydractinia symbiolongicarpus]